MKHAGQELAAARISAGLTQSDIARTLGIPQSRVSRIEHAENPRLDTLNSYARAIGLELVLVPRKLVGSVRAMLDDDGETVAGKRRGRVPTLAELIDAASGDDDPPVRLRSG